MLRVYNHKMRKHLIKILNICKLSTNLRRYLSADTNLDCLDLLQNLVN